MPANVVGVIRGGGQGDEITVMTERTADLLGLEEMSASAEGGSSVFRDVNLSPAVKELPRSSGKIIDALAEPQDPGEVHHEDPPPSQEDDDDENLRQTVRLDLVRGNGKSDDAEAEPDSSDDDAPAVVVLTSDGTADGDGEEGRDGETLSGNLSRHNLPEEFFLTNELSRSELYPENGNVLDDLGGSEFEELGDVDSNWEELAEELRETNEYEKTEAPDEPEVEEAETEGSPSRLDETFDDVPSLEAARASLAALEPSQVEHESEEEDEAPGEEGDKAPGEEEDKAPGEETQADDEAADESSDPVFQDPNFISAGYAMPLPFEIRPSGHDLDYGILASTLTDTEKERIFPLPAPKKRDEVSTRIFLLPPTPQVQPRQAAAPSAPLQRHTASISRDDLPKDRSLHFIGLFVLLMTLILVTVIVLF